MTLSDTACRDCCSPLSLHHMILQGHAHEQTPPRTTDGSRIPSGLNCSQIYMTCCGHTVPTKSECAAVMSAGTVQALAPLELEIIVRAVPLVPSCCCGLPRRRIHRCGAAKRAPSFKFPNAMVPNHGGFHLQRLWLTYSSESDCFDFFTNH
jgi:hypothetical protein